MQMLKGASMYAGCENSSKIKEGQITDKMPRDGNQK